MITRQTLREFASLLVAPTIDEANQRARITFMEESVILPVKAVLLGALCYYLFIADWFEGVKEIGVYSITSVRGVFLAYLFVNLAETYVLLRKSKFSTRFTQWTVFVVNFIDAVFLASLALLTGGLISIAYWVFLGFIVRNSVSVPVAPLQICANLLVIGCYTYASIVDKTFTDYEIARQFDLDETSAATSFQPYVIRIVLMLLVMVCCYGVQILFDKQRQTEEDLRESTLRQEQLQSAGRLAAEIAHQIKNPLSIITNVAFSLQRGQSNGKAGNVEQQLQIIRDEVGRADRIITELMGYAQLAEGKVEKLNVVEELDKALLEVFPPEAKYRVKVRKHYAQDLPSLQMQRGHLKEIFVNILINAREAMNGIGTLDVLAGHGPNYSVQVKIKDDGPGIPPDKVIKVFEAYFTTKSSGSGLGLAIVKHNAEIYGGTVQIETELGKGATFIIQLPAKTMLRIRK